MYAECNGFGLRHTALGMHGEHVFCKCDCKDSIGGKGEVGVIWAVPGRSVSTTPHTTNNRWCLFASTKVG